MTDLEVFERHRPDLLALAYRMLGDLQRAEDLIQEGWLRWQQRSAASVEAPRAYLVQVVTRLCLNELDSARSRREQVRGDRLPEPADLSESPLSRLEVLDGVSMAFLVVLQRLTAAERAVLLLHDVFDLEHAQIATLVERSEPACRQLLKRARQHVATEKRAIETSAEVHRGLLRAFLQAASSGEPSAVAQLLCEDALLIVDAGEGGGAFGRVRNLPGPLMGRERVAAFVAAVTPQGSGALEAREQILNGQPALLILRERQPYAVIALSALDGKIRAIFIQADPARLARLGPSAKGGSG